MKLVAVLNVKWRVSDDEDLQWVLQRARARKEAGGAASDVGGVSWDGNAYCNTRSALIRNIKERCGDVDPDALAIIEALPDRYPQPYVQRKPGKRAKNTAPLPPTTREAEPEAPARPRREAA